jgi:carbon storage regulator
MLVLTRKQGERIKVGDNIWITLVEIMPGGKLVRIGIDAPEDVVIRREEMIEGWRDDLRRRPGGRRAATGGMATKPATPTTPRAGTLLERCRTGASPDAGNKK